MRPLHNILKVSNEIVVKLAQNPELQRLIIQDQYDETATFTPLSVNDMLKEHYIYTMPQNLAAVEDVGKNTFLIVLLNHVRFGQEDANAVSTGAISIVCDIDHLAIGNNRDRSLELVNIILDELQGLKLSTTATLQIEEIERVNFTEMWCGMRINFRVADQVQKEVDF